MTILYAGRRLGSSGIMALTTTWNSVCCTQPRRLLANRLKHFLWTRCLLGDNTNTLTDISQLTPLTCAGQGPDWSNPSVLSSAQAKADSTSAPTLLPTTSQATFPSPSSTFWTRWSCSTIALVSIEQFATSSNQFRSTWIPAHKCSKPLSVF